MDESGRQGRLCLPLIRPKSPEQQRYKMNTYICSNVSISSKLKHFFKTLWLLRVEYSVQGQS